MTRKKHLFLIISIILILTSLSGVFAAPEGVYLENSKLSKPDIKSEAAILADLKTGRVIYSKNADEALYPASTTKIMTGILALEYGNLNDTVTASVSALAPITNEDSHMGILIGEQLTLEQLIYGMLVYSANDAANVIATHIAGTPENFVEIMNKKAEELGTKNTHFVNTYGIHDEDHYTTAEDLALITRYAMQNEKFREIVKTQIYKIPPTEKYTTERNLPNTNLFLSSFRSAEFYNQSVTGVKTGSTDAAGYCLVTTAQKDTTELLVITLKAPNRSECYKDSKKLLDLGFNNYSYTTIAASGNVIRDSKVYEAKKDTRVALTVKEDISALLPKDIDITESIVIEENLPELIKAPIKKGEVVGEIAYFYNDNEIGRAELVAANDVKRNNLLFLYHLIVKILTHPLFLIPAVLIIILIMIRRANIKKQEQLKRKRRLQNMQRNSRPDRYTSTDARRNPRYKR